MKAKIILLLILAVFALLLMNNREKEVVSAASQGPYQVVIQKGLGQIAVKDFKSMGFTHGKLLFSPDGQSLFVGTEDGENFLYDLKRKKIKWQRSTGIGRVTAVIYSHDGRYLYLGETSPEGKIYCLRAKDGREVWQTSVLADLGQDLTKKLYPQILSLQLDKDDRLYVSALRFDRRQKITKYLSRIYCLQAASGKRIWTFPQDRLADFWAGYLTLMKGGKELVWATSNYTQGKIATDQGHLYGVMAATGKPLWQKQFSLLPGENSVNIRNGPQIAPDGKKMVVFPSDGRLFCLDDRGNISWEKVIAQTKVLQGASFNTGGRFAYWLGEQIIAGTTNTFDNGNWQQPTPVEHPNGNAIFSYDEEGNLLWKWKAGGALEDLDYNDRYLWVPIGRNNQSEDCSVYGGYLLDYRQQGKLVYRYPTEGPSVVGAISPDQRYLAIIEAPIRLDDGITIVGKHRLHLLERK